MHQRIPHLSTGLWPPVITEMTHQLALVPAATVLVRGPTRMPPAFIYLAMAFAVSWVGDSLAGMMGGSWAAFYGWVPVQIILALFAVEVDRRKRWLAIPPIAALIPLSIHFSFPGPEVLIMTLGSVALVVMAKGPLRWPVLIYFGIGTALYVPMVMGTDFMQFWYGYQASRLGSILVFVALVLTWPKGGMHGLSFRVSDRSPSGAFRDRRPSDSLAPIK